jgi:sugar lactone lactonase YvrE
LALTCVAAFAQQPRIETLSPAQGPIAGGTIVSVRGANFTGASVALDRTPLAPLTQTDTQITVRMPPHDNGFAILGVGGARIEFLYVPPRLEEVPAGHITTIAGIGYYQRLLGPATNAALNASGLAYDGAGNLYAAQAQPGYVVRIRTDGTIEKIAGTGDLTSPRGDGGPAVDAPVDFPRSVALDPAGNVYLPDVSNRIRRVDGTTGIITTIAGTGKRGYSGDGGSATSADIGQPTYLAAYADSVYFIDFNAMRVRRVRNGIITTYVGNGSAGFSGDSGLATDASFDVGVDDNGGLALDSAGNLYLADSRNRRIRRIDRATNIITTYIDASDTKSAWYADHFAGIAFDHNDHLYFGGLGVIQEFDATGHYLHSWKGNSANGVAQDGPLANGYVGDVTGVAIDDANNIVYSDAVLQRVRRINRATSTIDTLAGIGPGILGENGPAIATAPQDLAFNANGELLVADACCGEEQRIRKLDARGNLVTIAGGGLGRDDFQAQPALNDFIDSVSGLVPDAAGNLDFISWAACVVRRLDTNANVRFLVGTRTRCGYTGDGGPASKATLCQPWDAARDRDGNLFIADTNNNRIRRVDAQSGIITTVVGNGGPTSTFEGYGHGTFCGDGGPAIDACIDTPYGVALDALGNLFIAENTRIRKVDTNGTISTFASGRFFPIKLKFDRAGYLYATRLMTIDRYDPAGNRTTLAGIEDQSGFAGDGGPALAAKLFLFGVANGIAIDRDGNIFFGDSQRIRAIRYGAVLAPPNASITAIAGGSTIAATVRDGAGRLAPGVRVEFAAPSSGASCSAPFAITDANGVATATCTPNCIAGSYQVEARPIGASAAAMVAFTNPGRPCRGRAARH